MPGEIRSNKGNTVEYIKPTAKLFLGKSIVLFGETNTGKSKFIRMILKALKKHIPLGVVFNGTEGGDTSYGDIFPDAYVYNRIDIETIKDIKEFQEAKKNTYNKANKYEVLKNLYQRIRTRESDKKLIKLHQSEKKLLRKCKNKKDKQKKIKNWHKDMRKKMYKKFVKENVHRINQKYLNNDEKVAIKFINLNPHILLVFDDVGSQFKAMYNKKENKEIIDNMFIRDRHNYITYIFAFQYEGQLDKDLRNNTRISVFTSSSAVIGYARKKANNIYHLEKYVNDIAPLIYQDDGNYYRMIYIKDEQKFKYIKSVEVKDNDCKFCWPEFYEYNSEIKIKNKVAVDRSNKFFNIFRVD